MPALTQTMFANFKVISNHDVTPALDREKTDVKYLLGVDLDFQHSAVPRRGGIRGMLPAKTCSENTGIGI